MGEFTTAEKIAELEREIAIRIKIFPAWIKAGRLSLDAAKRRVDILRAIAEDYRQDASTS